MARKKSSPILKVWIDSKEQKFVKKSKMFFDNKKIPNEVKSLEDGDLKILLQSKDVFLVERKRYDDFAKSYIKKHLQDQAIRMNNQYKYYCCIIHGDMSDIRRAAQYDPALKRIKQSSIQQMYQKMELIYKCPCFFVDNDVQYFNKVVELSKMLAKANGINTIVKTSVQVKEHPELSFLMVGNEIGEKTARLLINEFGSPQNVFEASREELKKVSGVGDITVSNIKELKEVFENGKKV